jgi:hypothetical protein
MNHPIAQFVALTCYANASLRGRTVPAFFPGNSTCRFCDSVEFVGPPDGLRGITRPEVAGSPDAWFLRLTAAGVSAVRLSRALPAKISGADTWGMDAALRDGRSARWSSRWEVWNQDAPERRIWRVCYACAADERGSDQPAGPLASVADRLRATLDEIHRFAERNRCGGFTASFAKAIETLDSGGARLHGYHRDLAPDGCLPPLATSVLDACQSAWVFGGIGSWNDLAFDGAIQVEYERITERLFLTTCDAIQAAANASLSADL